MAVSRSQQLKQLEPGLNVLFGTEYNRYPDEHSHFYETSNSNKAFEEDVKLAELGYASVVDEGQAVSYDNGSQEVFTARYTHVKVGMGFQITEEAMEDNLYVSLSSRHTRAMARSMAQTKQVRAMDLINRGFVSYNGPDGTTLFSTTHPTVSGQNNSNRPATPADLNEASLEAAIIQMADWVDERGLKINVRARKLIVPQTLQFVAKRILESDLRVSTSDNDLNALKEMRAIPEGFAVNHYLTDVNAWFLCTDVPNGMRHFVRKKITTKMEGDFDTGNVKYKAMERYSFGTSDPLAVFGSPGAT
jgi:hypothetical protein